jgi:leucyl aminopeptidase
MKFSFCTVDPLLAPTDLLVLGVFEQTLGETPLYDALDRALEGHLAQIVDQASFTAKQDQSLLVHSLGRLPAGRILLLGLGKREEFQVSDIRRYAATAAQSAVKCGAITVTLLPPPLDSLALDRVVQFLAEGSILGRYRFDRYRSEEVAPPDRLQSISVVASSERTDSLHLALSRGEIIAGAICRARDLVNEPACVLTPSALADAAQSLAKDGTLECRVLGPKECQKQRMGLFLAVARGSSEEPRFIHLTYRPRGKDTARRRIVLVGKGITFDSGGLSLKPTASMLQMKTDMAGAAALLGVAGAAPSLGLTSELHFLIPAAENMPSGSAYKVGDIVTGLAGKSVEIVNTDAEGRLALADALAYGAKLSPDEMIDIATLTGACSIALGPHVAGVMGNDLALVERFLAAARRAGEEAWPLPLPSRLRESLKSPVADLKNAGDRFGGALTAGLFLGEFVGQVHWLHLDIAGPAAAEEDHGHIRKGGTGFGVASLVEYLQSRDEI